MTTTARSRVRWNDDEKTLLATEMHRLLGQTPALSFLDAIRLAQLRLPPIRQREIKAWAIVEPMLGPVLAEIRRVPAARSEVSPVAPEATTGPALPLVLESKGIGSSGELPVIALAELALQGADELPAKADDSGDAANAENSSAHKLESAVESPPVDGLLQVDVLLLAEPRVKVQADEGAGTTAAAPVGLAEDALTTASGRPLRHLLGLDPLRIEAVLLAALRSPVVETTLVALFSKAMATAFASLESEEPTHPVSGLGTQTGPATRVLLAGFVGNQLKGLEDALRDTVEVRVWKPGQSIQLFETLAGICSVAVVPESSDDDFDSSVKTFNLKVLRHEGSPSRLAESILEMSVPIEKSPKQRRQG